VICKLAAAPRGGSQRLSPPNNCLVPVVAARTSTCPCQQKALFAHQSPPTVEFCYGQSSSLRAAHLRSADAVLFRLVLPIVSKYAFDLAVAQGGEASRARLRARRAPCRCARRSGGSGGQFARQSSPQQEPVCKQGPSGQCSCRSRGETRRRLPSVKSANTRKTARRARSPHQRGAAPLTLAAVGRGDEIQAVKAP
jgi:hypothetical protein